MEADRRLVETAEQGVEDLCAWLRMASISTKPEHAQDVRASAEWCAEWLDRAGVETTIWETDGAPVVFGRVDVDSNAPTVLIYGHYDVQPEGDLSLWSSPPFEPTIRDGQIYARGTADNKGQIFVQMRAVGALIAANELRVNVRILVEGEEEVGSPNLAGVLEKYRDDLACDIVAISDTPVWKPGQPALSLGVRGNIGAEVRVTGPNRDLHSGIYGGSVPNPIATLARMIAALHDDDGRVTIPGFYDDVDPIPDAERQAWASLDHDDNAYAKMLGCGLSGEHGYSTLERRWGRPTLEFNGITGGYQGPGSNTIVPNWASVKITGRMVPGQDAEQHQRALVAYIESLAPDGVDVVATPREKAADAYRIDPSHPALASAARAFEAVYDVKPVLIREGLSLPILTSFKRILGADTVLLGFCDPDCNAHSFDEFFGVDDLLLGSRTAARFLTEYHPS